MQFALVGFVVLMLLGLATAMVSRQAGTTTAIGTAREVTVVLGRGVIEPALTDGLVNGDRAAVAALDAIVRGRVLNNSLVRVKIWAADGTILYSDENRLIGSIYELGSDEAATLRTGKAAADVSDLSQPENRFERAEKKLLQVYVPVHTPAGQVLLFEAYHRYSSVQAAGHRVWWAFAPWVLGALGVLELVQVPIAWSMARRLQQRKIERERLLRQAVDASDAERRRIASDLHDGVVQDLAAVSYSLAAVSESLPAGTLPDTLATLEQAATGTRRSIRSLRSMLVDIYPPSLHDAGLAVALSDLLASVPGRGVDARLDIDTDLALRPQAEAIVYRIAQEAMRNVMVHSGASLARIRISQKDGRVLLSVRDNGHGFDSDDAACGPARGHFGLRLLADLAADAGGQLHVVSSPGEGTEIRLAVPA